MVEKDRSFSDVLQDIVGNVQDIVRSELRLAKAEIREEATKAKASSVMLGAGALIGFFAILFLLLTVVSGLALVVPVWAANLIVGGVLAAVASVMFPAGVKLFKQIHPAPEHTIESMRENVEWAKQQAK